MKIVKLLFVAIAPIIYLSLWGCEGPFDPPRDETGEIVVDEFEVTIVRDETPGFLYPLTRHDMHFIGHLTVAGVIDSYFYQSENIGIGVFIDYVSILPPGEKFRFDHQLWEADKYPIGTDAHYEFTASSSNTSNFQVSKSITVRSFQDGPRPSAKSRQLTGPFGANHYSPFFSRDRQWIYCRRHLRENTKTQAIVRIPAHGGAEETLFETVESLGGFALLNNDSTLVYSIWQPQQKTPIFVLDLILMKTDKLEFDIDLGSTPFVPIPATNKLIAHTGFKPDGTSELVMIDINERTLEVVATSDNWDEFVALSYRPGTQQISFGRFENNGLSIYLLDLTTKEQQLFLQLENAFDFAWASNGSDYAYTKGPGSGNAYNIFFSETGSERQVTIYPGSDAQPVFAPDNRSIAFMSTRRNETQIWRVDL